MAIQLVQSSKSNQSQNLQNESNKDVGDADSELVENIMVEKTNMSEQQTGEALVAEEHKYQTVGQPLMDEPKMSMRNVTVHYAEKQAIFDVDLDIGKNQVISMIGPSGCGKSTFLRCLNRMNDTIDICRVGGSIELEGVDIYDRSIDVVELRARVGMVFQKPNPFPKSIYENVAYGARIHGLTDNKVQLDELVEQSTATIEELIHELSENFTIAIVTHSMQQAARVSQRTAYFHLGKLIEVNETSQVFTNPEHQLTEEYITGRIG